VLKVCDCVSKSVCKFVNPIPTSTSLINLSIVSLVILFLTSSTITSPIGIDLAYDTAGSGSETGVSRSTCGNKFVTFCENLSDVNGSTAGLLVALRGVK